MKTSRSAVFVGCAGWSIPAAPAASFPGAGSHLERYARVLPAVEINSTFQRWHRAQTYERWTRSVPQAFRFSVKAPREITHERRLWQAEAVLRRFLQEVKALGARLGPVLFQLPPSLEFEARRARAFLKALRELHVGPVALEPRHESWFEPIATQFLEDFQVTRVAADPPPVPEGARPGGWPGLVYFRLHGSPQMYRSPYSKRYLRSLADSLAAFPETTTVWCIFDNTASGAAAGNAIELLTLLRPLPPV